MKGSERLLAEAALGVALAAIGLSEAWTNARDLRFVDGFIGEFLLGAVVALLFSGAGALHARFPAVALLAVWAGAVVQVVGRVDVMVVESVAGLVAYGAARFGSRPLVLVSGASILGGAPLAALFARRVGLPNSWLDILPAQATEAIQSLTQLGTLALLTSVAFAFLVIPWLVGLTLRWRDASERSRTAQFDAERALAQSEELINVREGQARLARDVHDVVGHSLAVILVQAESAQFIEEPERLQATLATIAQSARSSLHDVRDVLSSTGDGNTGDIAELIENLRAGGQRVDVSVSGQPRSLPPELATVAYRVMQEMLTNALRHGAVGSTVEVDQAWGDDLLVICVGNAMAPGLIPAPAGSGLTGMRSRLAAVGGKLEDAGPVPDAAGDRWLSRASLPVRARYTAQLGRQR